MTNIPILVRLRARITNPADPDKKFYITANAADIIGEIASYELPSKRTQYIKLLPDIEGNSYVAKQSHPELDLLSRIANVLGHQNVARDSCWVTLFDDLQLDPATQPTSREILDALLERL